MSNRSTAAILPGQEGRRMAQRAISGAHRTDPRLWEGKRCNTRYSAIAPYDSLPEVGAWDQTLRVCPLIYRLSIRTGTLLSAERQIASRTAMLPTFSASVNGYGAPPWIACAKASRFRRTVSTHS